MVATRPKHVLIVDDNPHLRSVLAHTLEDAGMKVAGLAADAVEALAVVRAQPVDVVLLDMRMPGLTGMQLAHILRVERPDVPVVLMSAYEAKEHSREARAAGAVAMVDKAAPEELLARVLAAAEQPLHLDR